MYISSVKNSGKLGEFKIRDNLLSHKIAIYFREITTYFFTPKNTIYFREITLLFLLQKIAIF